MTKAKILVVDDNFFTREVQKDLLIEIGYKEIYEAEDGKQAISEFKKQKPDLVLLDIILPDTEGDKVLAEIKDINPKQKVIMVTAVGHKLMTERCKKLGVSGYVLKPINPDKLEAIVKKVLSKS